MADHQYSYRELELLFKRIDEKLDDIRSSIKENSDTNEKRFIQIEHEIELIRSEVEDLKTFKTRTLAYWGVGLTAVTIAINKLL
jgi:hypothetical protein